jgi:hypothetical protein
MSDVREVKVSIKDPLTVLISESFGIEEEMYGEGGIQALRLPDSMVIRIGDLIKVGNRSIPYRVNLIRKRDVSGLPNYELKMALRTKATLFVLPMLPGTKKDYLFGTQLLNVFISTSEEDNVIAVLFRFSGARGFLELETKLRANSNFIRSFDPNAHTVMYVFQVPSVYEEQFELFKEGKYSHLSVAYKKKVLRFHSALPDSTLGMIMSRHPKKREELERKLDVKLFDYEELYSIPDLDQERFNPEIYKL